VDSGQSCDLPSARRKGIHVKEVGEQMGGELVLGAGFPMGLKSMLAIRGRIWWSAPTNAMIKGRGKEIDVLKRTMKRVQVLPRRFSKRSLFDRLSSGDKPPSWDVRVPRIR